MKKFNLINLFICIFLIYSCGGGGSAPFTLTLPNLSSISINEDNPYTSTIGASTNYKSVITYEILNSTINGSSEITSNGSYNYLPNQDFFGNDNVTIQVKADRLGDDNLTTGETLIKTLPISIVVNPVNDPPVINITDELNNFSNLNLMLDDSVDVKVNIVDVDNDLSEILFYGQLPNETVNAEIDIKDDQQSLIFNLKDIQSAGLFTMSICADDGTDLACEGNLEAYFISDKDIKTVSYDCDENGENCSTSDQYLYYLVGGSDSTAKTEYIFIADQINDSTDSDEFHLRLLESVNNLRDSDASEVFNDYFNIRVLEESNPTGASIFKIEKGCYVNWDERIYCIGNVDRGMIGDVVGNWNVVSFLTTLEGRGVAQGAVNIQPLSSRSAEIVQHELGHSHGFMGDEYDSRGERTFPSWYAEFSVNTTAVSDPSLVKWNHFIEDMTNIPGVDYDVCYNYADGDIYYRDDLEYEDCECFMNTYDEDHPDYDPNYPGINVDDSCKDKIGLFQGTYYDEVDSYRPKWISVMWCCFLDYGKINVEGFAIGSITNQFNGFGDFTVKSDISEDVDLDNSESLGEYITFDVNGVFDTNRLKLSWYLDGIEQTNLENQLEVTFDRPIDDAMTTYSWQVHDLSGNLIAPNDPLNPRDLYEGIFNMWSYYDPDPNTNPNNNPNYPYVGTWYWHRTDGINDTDDTVDLSNIDNYLYAEQCCAMGYGYKINWKNYKPSANPSIKLNNYKRKSLFNTRVQIGEKENLITVNLSNTNIDIKNLQLKDVQKEFIKNNNISFKDKYMITFHDNDMKPIYTLGLGNPFETRLQHIGYEKESIFNVEIPIKNYKVAFPKDINAHFITYSKRAENNTFEAIEVIKLQ
ncbi:MAG: M64 family metallopeptidase [Gammaproteobacteria bacterium]